MFKFIGRLIILALIAGILFFALSFWKGGDPFRWFGSKSKEAGIIIKEKSENLGKEADKIQEKTSDLKDATKKVTKGIQQTGEAIQDITGYKKEKEEK
jgi:hypothetical protein